MSTATGHDVDTRPAADGPPRSLLAGALALITLTVALIGVVRYGGYETSLPQPAPVVESRELRFDDRPDGGIAITDAADGRLIETVRPGEDGFLRGTMRSLVRERRQNGIGAEPPFRLSRLADGTITIADPATDRVLNLRAFGEPNAQNFGRLLKRSAQP